MNAADTAPVTAEIVSAFVDERNGGNLAGVVLDRPDLSETQQQAIAAELALSETAFLVPTDDGFRFDVFTPTVRVPDCGHATIAAFGLLAQRCRIPSGATIKHTIAGPRAIRIDDGAVFMQQPTPTFTHLEIKGPAIAASLGVTDFDVFAGYATLAKHDVAFIIIALTDVAALAALTPDMTLIQAVTDEAGAIGYYVYAPGSNGVDATARMFAPGFGIPEESATGMAGGLLAAYLHDRGGIRRETISIDQGVFMSPPSPSRIIARLTHDRGRLTELWVGGIARTQSTRTVRAMGPR